MRFERETRLASWVIYLGCTAWVVWVGATRWNAVPDGAALSIDPDLDRTRELVAALEALPPDPPLSFPPAPEGMSWAPGQRWWDAVSIRAGEWSPATRPDQYTAMKHFQTAEVTRALSMLAAVEPGGWRVEIPWLSGMCRAASLLAMRARYRQAERGDVDAALADLRATLRLAGLNHRSRRVVGILTAFGSPALGELRQLSRERALSRKQACGTVEVIRSELPERDEGWSLMIDAEFASMFQVIGACYTREGDGGGWLVLNRMDYALYSMSEPRYGAWNLLSVVFNDRGAVLAKIKPSRASLERALGLPFAEAAAVLDVPVPRQDFNLLDGLLVNEGAQAQAQKLYRISTRDTADQRGTILAVFLSAYRHEHGVYPEALDELVPEYLDRLPLDPYVDEPFRYARNEDGTYLLYSLREDQIDDGGTVCQGVQAEGCDWVYSRPRCELRYQFLVEKGGGG